MPRLLRASGRAAPFRPDVLPSGEGPDGAEAGPQWLLPRVDLESWREAIFPLCWHQHGGSGLDVSIEAALELETSDRDWLLERMETQRSREAREIERAGKKR